MTIEELDLSVRSYNCLNEQELIQWMSLFRGQKKI